MRTSAPLCAGADCSSITVELRRGGASSSGDGELVDVIATSDTNASATVFKWPYVPSKVLPAGHTYFIMVKIAAPSGHPEMSTTMRSDDFVVLRIEREEQKAD